MIQAPMPFSVQAHYANSFLKVEDLRCGPVGPANLYCERGELLALTGPSGSGKTSLLRAIAGLIRPSSGLISLGETQWFKRSEHKAQKTQPLSPQERQIGMVFQEYALFPHLTALENIAIAVPKQNASSNSIEKIERLHKAREWLARMHLGELAERFPHQLSGGQKQRVALARALAREPKLLLLDEPFSAVDQVTRLSLQKELVKVRRELSIPVIVVTHDLHEARFMADQLVIMHQSRTLQNGKPEHVMRRPRNHLVAKLVGIPNIFSGKFIRLPSEVLRAQMGRAPDASYAALIWQGQPLYVQDKGRLPDGQTVYWVIAGDYIRIADLPTDNTQSIDCNQITGQVQDITRLGEIVVFEVQFPGGDEKLSLQLSAREAAVLMMKVGSNISLQFDPSGIHLMPIKSD